MVYGAQFIAALFKPFAVLGGDAEIRLNQTAGSNAAETDQKLRLYKPQLGTQKIDAYILFFGKRIAVVRRPAF